MGTHHDVDIAIIGSGFAGVAMAIRLKQEGIEDFAVLERGAEWRTWHGSTDPGGLRRPLDLYSLFAPNPGWGETYSRQPEIRDSLRGAAHDYGIRPQCG